VYPTIPYSSAQGDAANRPAYDILSPEFRRRLEINMRAFGISLILLSTAAMAQQPAEKSEATEVVMQTFASSADVQALIAKARRERKEGQPVFSQRILTLAPYRVSLEYRASVGPATIHEKEAELFYVIEGSATMVTGGKLIDAKLQREANLQGTGIDGGTSRTIAKGDFIIVPENTPHWFSGISETLIVMSFHVPREVDAKH
jgi:mannose-6-phosphate isomerase-like protein (cupin superfamily)